MKAIVNNLCVSFILIFYANFSMGQSSSDAVIREFWQNYAKNEMCAKVKGQPGYKIFEIDSCKIIFYGTSHLNMDLENYIKLDSLIIKYRPTIYFTEAYAPTVEAKEKSTQGDIFFMQYSAVDRGKKLLCWNDDYEDVFFNLSKKYGNELGLIFRTIINAQYYNLNDPKDYRHLSLSCAIKDVILTTKDFDFSYYQNETKRIINKYTASHIAKDYLLCQDTFKMMYVDYQYFRDRQLLDNIREAIPKYKIILVQAGDLHLRSFESMVKNGLLKKEDEDNTLQRMDGGPIFNISNQLPVNSWFLIRNNKIVSSIEKNKKGLKQLIDLIAMDSIGVILSHGSHLVYPAKSNINSGLREEAISKGIRVKNWMQNWAHVYPQLTQKFTYNQLFIFAYLKTIIENRNNLLPLKIQEDFDLYIYNSMWSNGFPFEPSDHLGISDFYRHLKEMNIAIPVLNYKNIKEMSEILTKYIDEKIDTEFESIQTEHLNKLIPSFQDKNKYLVIETPDSISIARSLRNQ